MSYEGRRLLIFRRRASTCLIAVVLLAACEDRTRVRTEGDWRIDRVRVSGPEQSYAHFALLYRNRTVDTDISLEPAHLRFFPPDCAVYRPNRQGPPFYAVCGDRTPALLPAWVSHVTERVVSSGRMVREARTTYEVADIAVVMEAARRQPARRSGWERRPHAAVHLESRLVDSRPF